MTTPNVYPFYMSWIQDEFGGSAWGYPWYLSWYYAGGSWVPAGTTGALGAIPTSGYVTVDHYRNASKYIYNGNMVAGASGNATGYWWDVAIGSMSPDNLNGVGFRILTWNTSNQIVLTLWGDTGNGGWNNLIVDNTHTLTRASASYSAPGGGSQWVWGGASKIFNNGQTHSIKFN